MANRFSPGCDCCSEECVAWLVDLSKDVHPVSRVARYGASSPYMIVVEVNVSTQTGFGFSVEGVPVLKGAAIFTQNWVPQNLMGVAADVLFPENLTEANSLYTTSTKSATTFQSENLIGIMPSGGTTKLTFLFPAFSSVFPPALVASQCRFHISRVLSGFLAPPSTDWQDRLIRVSEGIYETKDPLPEFMVLTEIDKFNPPLITNTTKKYLYEVFTKNELEVKTTLFSQTWEYIDIENASTYRDKLKTFTINPGPIENYPNPSASGFGPAINWPRLVDGSRMLQSDGTRGKIWHREHVPSRPSRDIWIVNTLSYGLDGKPLQHRINRRNVEFIPGFNVDTEDRRINGWSSSGLVDLFEDTPIYVRFGITRGQTFINHFSIQQYYDTETGLNELCPNPSLRQELIPNYSQLDLFASSISLSGTPFESSYQAGIGTGSISGWDPDDYILPTPKISVSVTGSFAGGWTANASSVSFPERFGATGGVGITNIYQTLPAGTITSLTDPYGYVYDPKFPRGTIASGGRHFWYDPVAVKWIYEGQTHVPFRATPPTGAELDTIVALLADGGEYWFRTGTSYFSVDDSGEIVSRDKNDFTASLRYVSISAGARVSGTNASDLASRIANLKFSLPSNGETTLFDLSGFGAGSVTYSYRKVVRGWTESDKPTIVFTYADYVPNIVSAGEISELYDIVALLNGASVAADTDVVQTSPTAFVQVPYTLSFNTYPVTAMEITVTP